MMMGINQSYLIALLLASLTASCSSDCTTIPDEPLHLYEPLYDPKPPYRECAKLYSMLEAALLENSGNLYKLYDSFFPSSSVEPTYVQVQFTLHKMNESLMNAYSSFACWTSSIVLKSVDPNVLAAIQPNLLNLLLQTVGASELTNKNIAYGEQLDLDLLVNVTVSDQNSTTVDAVVQDFTLLVSAQINLLHFISKCTNRSTCKRL